MLDLEKITLKVREIALRAGAFLRKERSGFDRSKVEKKNAHDYVSYVDKESERRIVAQLRELLPDPILHDLAFYYEGLAKRALLKTCFAIRALPQCKLTSP